MTKPLLIMGHLGLGDHIICNGLVRWYAAREEQVIVPCWERNMESVRFMLSDLPNVSVYSIEENEEREVANGRPLRSEWRELRLGHYSSYFSAEQWDRSFYEQAGVPFDERWDGFALPPIVNPFTPPTADYAFIHEDTSRGLKITKGLPHGLDYEVRPEPIKTIFHWLPAMEQATAIHLINSSFAALADSIHDSRFTRARGVFIHAYARPGEALPAYRQPSFSRGPYWRNILK